MLTSMHVSPTPFLKFTSQVQVGDWLTAFAAFACELEGPTLLLKVTDNSNTAILTTASRLAAVGCPVISASGQGF